MRVQGKTPGPKPRPIDEVKGIHIHLRVDQELDRIITSIAAEWCTPKPEAVRRIIGQYQEQNRR